MFNLNTFCKKNGKIKGTLIAKKQKKDLTNEMDWIWVYFDQHNNWTIKFTAYVMQTINSKLMQINTARSAEYKPI